ncbi:flagellar motor switch protein FliM [Cellulomonas carbonis]|uniref:Flagellar motor switch protein FliM n=1 Tax=Cellulomonas carbonis T26 TaxID=947969 RepID=A0A0A0BMD0_9CELL|nr:flagellar motor switch protein FliM [Cellulomonas carbonis]KGM08852.1 flagellar motor switch protein FliM [Cellulomonas carbonis T26]
MTVQEAPGSTRRKRSGVPEVYDFRRPMTLAREHARALEMGFETFARQWGTQLTSRLRVVAQATLDTVEMRSYDEYVRSLPPMTTMVLCGVEQGRSTAVLQLPSDATMLWVDYLLGGPGLASGPDRELTDIEWQLVRELLGHALADLHYAFASICPLDVNVKSVQYAPQFVQAAAASEPVIIASFTMQLGKHESTATFMVPAEVMLAQLLAGEALDSRTVDEVREHELALDAIAGQVQEVPVSIGVRFRPQTVAAAEIATLALGDVVPLRHRGDQPLDVVIGDVVLARAAMGANGSRLACLVVTSEENH